MSQVVEFSLAVDCQSLLGEGVTWDSTSQTLFWLDIDGCLLHSLDRGNQHHVRVLSAPTSVVVPTVGGELLAVSGLEVGLLGVDGSIGEPIAVLPADGDGRANDGRCDPHGRLWIGTVDRSGKNQGGLFCVDDAGEVTRIRDGRALSNGIDWSPDGKKCYHVDSLHRTLDELTLDSIGFPIGTRTLATFDLMPDGVTVDAEGGIWVALWDGGGVVRFTPDGEIDCRLLVAGGWITSCAFGGSNLQTLYVTSARVDLDSEQMRQNPSAGSLFACDVGVSGRGYTAFGAIGNT